MPPVFSHSYVHKKLRTVLVFEIACLEGSLQAYAFYNGDINGKIFKNSCLAIKSTGARYSALISTS